MKHFTQRIRMLFIALAAATAMQAEIITATIDGLSYQLDTETLTATVTGGDHTPDLYDLIIPDKIIYQDAEFTVTEIGDNAFFDAFGSYRNFRSITLPETLTRIGDGAFADCTSLMHIFCHTEAPIALDADVAYWSEESVPDCFVHVRPGTAEAYRQADVWKDFSHIEENIDAVKIEEIDNIEYFLDGKKQIASVMKHDSYYGGNLIIPDKVVCDGIEYTVTAIEHGALYTCKSIESLTLPAGLTKIGKYALCGIGNVPIYCYAESPAEVSENTFSEYRYNYTNVLHVKPGTGDAYRDADVWKNFTNIVEDLTFITATIDNSIYRLSEGSPKTATLISCQDNTGNVRIPDNVSYNGEEYTVVGIGEKVFYLCTELTGITLPKSLTSIGDNAFYVCNGLTEITLPESLISIGYGAFSSCTGLTNITLPENLTTIGDATFRNCTGLTEITLPEGLTSIGDETFYSCSGLTEITLPQSLTSIGDWAFYGCSGLTEITLPQGLTSIGGRAFLYCSGLTNITLPEGLTTIGYGVFHGSGLTEITLPQSITSIGDYAFSSCLKLTNITLPEGLTSIGKCTFQYCRGLTEITLPKSLTSIGDYAFEDCSGLTEITLPQSLTSIGNWAFYDCSGLTSITLPESLISIGVGAFYSCTGLTEITIPENVNSIGGGAFGNCTGMTDITVSPQNTYYTSVNGILFSADHSELVAYPAGKEQTEYTVPEEAVNIAGYAFAGCTALTGITLPKSLTTIGDYAFRGCTGLTEITLPKNITSIGDYAFYDCSNLADIFCYINNPEQVEFPGTPNPWDADTYANCTLHVITGKGDDYRNTEIWKNFTNIVEDLETGIQEAKANDDSRIVLDGNGLTLGGAAWTVSTIDGRAVAQGNSRQTLCLPTGIYVVRCGSTVKKFYIK